MNFDLCAWAVGPGRCFLYLALDRHQPTDVFSRKDLHTNLNGCWRGNLLAGTLILRWKHQYLLKLLYKLTRFDSFSGIL